MTTSSIKPEQRQEEILSRLRALQTQLSVEELASEFGVSALTIRRDLEQLEARGAVLRTHGGCILKTGVESTYHQRVATNFALKQAIGRLAAQEVEGVNTIMINDGSTTFHLAAHLGGKGPLSVYTNSIAMIPEISRFPDVRLYILGGEFDRRMYLLGGNITEQILEMLYFDVVFMGADAIDRSGWCLVPSLTEARLTQIILRRGKRKILLADHTKCTKDSHAAYARVADFDLWITTPGMQPELLDQFHKLVLIKEAN